MFITRQHRELQHMYQQLLLQKQLLEESVQEKNEVIEQVKSRIPSLKLLIEDLKGLAAQQQAEILTYRKESIEKNHSDQ